MVVRTSGVKGGMELATRKTEGRSGRSAAGIAAANEIGVDDRSAKAGVGITNQRAAKTVCADYRLERPRPRLLI